MYATILNPTAIVIARTVNARAFNSRAAKFTNFATKSGKSRWFGATTIFIDYSTKQPARHLEGLTT